MRLTILILLLALTGCDTINTAFTGCTRRDVDGVDCVVCGGNKGSTSVDCGWK